MGDEVSRGGYEVSANNPLNKCWTKLQGKFFKINLLTETSLETDMAPSDRLPVV